MKTPLALLTATLASAITLVLGGCAQPSAAPRQDLAYRVLGSLPGQLGSFDYLSVEQPSGRVFVGRGFGVEVSSGIDGDRPRTLLERQTVASVLQIGPSLLLTTNRGMNTATLLDRSTGQVLADLPTGRGPDGAAYDAASGHAFVMNGSHDITVIDIPTRRVVASIPLDATPEAGVTDGAGRLFVNLEETHEVAVIDIASNRVTARYPLSGCEDPTGLSRDPLTGLLAAACRNGVLKFVDGRDGADRGQLEIGKGADASVFDPARRLGFVPCLDGTLTIYRLDEAGRVTATQRMTTRPGARTAAYDAQRDRLYIAVADVERDAAGKYLRARENFQVMVVGSEAPAR